AFNHASKVIAECPALDVGVHLTLIEERPLSSPSQVPTLVGYDGRFFSSYREFAARMVTGKVSTVEIRREFQAQIERVIATGRRPSHLDAHQHIHVLPSIWHVTTELARQYGIRWIRVPHFDSLFASRRTLLDPLFRLGLNVLRIPAAAMLRTNA